ncbi:MAG: DUF898 family protein [Pseudomonadota bacterium]
MATLKTTFGGDRGELFLLALKTGFLTLITAGMYRFWATTRLRRWYWSAVRPGGAPLEYTGTGIEKLTGFLFAIILLAVVLTLANIAGIMGAIGLSGDLPHAYYGALAVLPMVMVPMWFFARYRARRYILSRTRWRAIRFGMSRGALGYAWRATLYTALTWATFGLLWPLMTFRLEKYLTDRTWYGTARFTQHGSAGRLYGPLLPFLFSLWGSFALIGYFSYANAGNAGAIFGRVYEAWALIAGLVAFIFSILFAVYYRVASVRVLAALKTMGDGVELDLYPRTRRVVRIYFFGWWKTYLAAGFASNVVFGAVLGVVWLTGNFRPEMVQDPPIGLAATIAVLTYLLVMLMVSTFRQTFITYPLVQHISETLELREAELLGTVRQRDADRRSDAGGFADALNAGAAF